MEDEIIQIGNALLRGEIVLTPTDTVYGLAVSPESESAVERLYEMKDRPRKLPLPIMIASAVDLIPLGIDVNKYAAKLINSKYMPGALTLILGFVKEPLVPWLKSRKEVAVRIPNDERLLKILEKTGPLLVTSANKHGLPTLTNAEEVIDQLLHKPDVVVKGESLGQTSSTIINCRVDPPAIERLGLIEESELKECLYSE